MFQVEEIGGFNPFEWKDFLCPICKKNDFTSLSHAKVVCDHCNAEFVVRMTGGDPGCVVDCLVEKSNIYAPSWICRECSEEKGFNAGGRGFMEDETPFCNESSFHTMIREEHISRPWNKPEGFTKYFYLILKLGDYCSSWITGEYDKNGLEKLGFPTEEQWSKFQETLIPKKGLGVTHHARYILIPKEKEEVDIPLPM